MLEIKIRYKENCCTDVTWEEGLDAQGLDQSQVFKETIWQEKKGLGTYYNNMCKVKSSTFDLSGLGSEKDLHCGGSPERNDFSFNSFVINQPETTSSSIVQMS